MKDLYLSFRTQDGVDDAEWGATAIAILRELGKGLEVAGFSIDYEAGRGEPDFVFLAHRDETAFGLAMTMVDTAPCRWVIGLEDCYQENLQSPAIRREVHPILQTVIESWPGVLEIGWYDQTSLRELW